VQSIDGDDDSEAPADACHHAQQQPRTDLRDELRDDAEAEDKERQSNGASQHVSVPSQSCDERLELAEVLPYRLADPRKTGSGGGVARDEVEPAIALNDRAVLIANRHVTIQDSEAGHTTEEDDDVWFDDAELLQHVRSAMRDVRREWLACRPAIFHDAGEVHRTFIEPDIPNRRTEPLSRSANERSSRLGLVTSRCFTDEHHVCIGISFTGDRLPHRIFPTKPAHRDLARDPVERGAFFFGQCS